MGRGKGCLVRCLKRRLGWLTFSVLLGALAGILVAAATGQAWAVVAIAGALGGSMTQFYACKRECRYG